MFDKVSFITALEEQVMVSEKQNDIVWEPFIEDGYRAYLNGRYRDAELLYKAALAMAEQTKTFFHYSVGRLFSLLGDLYSDRHQYAIAEKFYKHALTVYEKLFGNTCIDVPIIIKRISEMCRAQGKFIEAVQLNRRSEELIHETRKQLDRLFRKNITVTSNK